MNTRVANDAAIAVRLSQSRVDLIQGAGDHEAERNLSAAIGLLNPLSLMIWPLKVLS